MRGRDRDQSFCHDGDIFQAGESWCSLRVGMLVNPPYNSNSKSNMVIVAVIVIMRIVISIVRIIEIMMAHKYAARNKTPKH